MSSRMASPLKTLHAAVAVLALTAVLLAGCDKAASSTVAPTSTQATTAVQTTTSAPERATQTAFKGMELYSWQTETGEWRFSIIFGTNRGASLAEVQASPMSLDETKTAISRLAVGESLFWVDRPLMGLSSGETVVLPIPPDEVVEELRQYAAEWQVELHVPGD
jgi:hypothetical protein